MTNVLHVGILAGEASGDVLGSGLMRALKQRHPNIRFTGIGGKQMIAEGLSSLVDMEELSVMGLVEVLSRLPRLLAIKKRVLEHFANDIPDVFIGVDAPDFNLRIETELKSRGVKTVHYVSPTVWAWREKRIHKIAKATNLVLGLFPFEQQIYDTYAVPYTFVGHTLADSIPLEDDGSDARKLLALEADSTVLALLPGSRNGEVNSLISPFLNATQITAKVLAEDKGRLQVVIPAANQARYEQIQHAITEFFEQCSDPAFDIHLVDGQTRECLLAANAVLIASGTATLEALLCKRPMVVAYKMAKLTRFIMGYLYKPEFFALPNLLARRAVVTELLQEDVNPDMLSKHLLPLFGEQGEELKQTFNDIHIHLRKDADQQAAEAVLALIH